LEIVGISIDFERDLEKARKLARTVAHPTAMARPIIPPIVVVALMCSSAANLMAGGVAIPSVR
jgi:hypothetical protein